jgi:flagellin
MQISNDSGDQIELSAQAFRSIGVNGTDYITIGAATSDVDTYVGAVGNTKTAYLLTAANTYSAVSVTRTASGYLVNDVPFTVNQSAAASKLYKVDPASENGQAVDLRDAIDLAAAATNTTAASLYADVQEMATSYVEALSDQRSMLGAYQNRLEYTLSNITELSTNLTASRSRVIDTDYASETANLTRNQILQQAATAMLAQANQMPNVILTLLK